MCLEIAKFESKTLNLLNLGLIGNSVRVFYNNAEAAPATVDSNIHTFYTTEHKSVWEGYMNYKL